jgi:hypothetical protein
MASGDLTIALVRVGSFLSMRRRPHGYLVLIVLLIFETIALHDHEALGNAVGVNDVAQSLAASIPYNRRGDVLDQRVSLYSNCFLDCNFVKYEAGGVGRAGSTAEAQGRRSDRPTGSTCTSPFTLLLSGVLFSLALEKTDITRRL